MIENQLNTFPTLIAAVWYQPVLALSKMDLPYSIDTDAFEYGMGWKPFQTHDDGDSKPIAYLLPSIKPTERN